MSSPEYPTDAVKERTTVFLVLLALLSTLLVFATPAPSASADDTVPDGCAFIYLNLVTYDSYPPGPVVEGEEPAATVIEEHLLCNEGNPNINEVYRGEGEPGDPYYYEGANAFIPGFTIEHLHLSCSDPIDVEVEDTAGNLVGFDSTESDFDGWLAQPFQLEDGSWVAEVGIINTTHPNGDPPGCGPMPLEEFEPDPGSITATKALADGTVWPEGGTFTFVLYDSEVQVDAGDATDADRTVTFDPVDAGTYTVCEEGLDEHWELIGVTVDGDAVDDEDGCVDVTVGEGETAAVVFTNGFDEPTGPAGITIELVKTNDADGDGTFTGSETAPEVGADVDFHLRVMNTNATGVVVDALTDSYGGITVDLLAGTLSPEGAAALADNTCAALDGATLAAGESATCTFTLDGYAPEAGAELVNTAVVAVHEDGRPDNTADDADTSTVGTDLPVIVTDPAISLVKEADVDEAQVGAVITYTYTVTNTGDVTLSDITLDDDVLGEIGLESTTLEPGGSTTGAATHTVTEDDLEANEVVNVAIVTGWPPEGDAVTDEDDASVVIFEQAVEDVVLEPAPAEETLPRTGVTLLALLVWALAALGLGAGTLRAVPRNRRMTT